MPALCQLQQVASLLCAHLGTQGGGLRALGRNQLGNVPKVPQSRPSTHGRYQQRCKCPGNWLKAVAISWSQRHTGAPRGLGAWLKSLPSGAQALPAVTPTPVVLFPLGWNVTPRAGECTGTIPEIAELQAPGAQSRQAISKGLCRISSKTRL